MPHQESELYSAGEFGVALPPASLVPLCRCHGFIQTKRAGDRVPQESRIPKRDGNGRADSLPTSRFSARAAAVMLLRRNVLRQLCVKGIIDARAPPKKERTKSTKSFSNSHKQRAGGGN